MYDTYDSAYGNYTPADELNRAPAEDPYGFGQPRVTGYRSGKPSGWTPMPEESIPDDFVGEIGYAAEGGGYLYPFEQMWPAMPETQGYDPVSLGDGATIRSSNGRPAWGEDGSRVRAQDQGGPAAKRHVAGSDWAAGEQLDYGFQNKHPGEVAEYYQEPDDSYFKMGRNAYPETNPPFANTRAQARGTDAPRANIAVRTPGAKQKRYIMSKYTQDAMRPISYSAFWEGGNHRPVVSRQANTIATTMGMPDWQYYDNQPSPQGGRTIPADPSSQDNLDPGTADGYTEEDVYY